LSGVLKLTLVSSISTVALFAVLTSAPAAAQVVELEGIVVTGTKAETDLQDTTTGVQIFTSEEIENSSIEDIDDVLDQTSNVVQRFGGEGFAIRGINNANVVGGGRSPLATLYVDGAPFNSFALRTGIEELWDVDQVEVFKGPQSTSFGRNALAGTVVIKTKDPEYRNTMKARVGGGTQGTKGFAATINASLIDQVLAVRLSGDFNDTDGFNNNPTLGIDDQAFSSNKTLRGKVLFEPTSAFRNVLTMTFSKNESGDDFVDNVIDPFDRNYFGNIQGGENTETVIAALDSKLDLDENWHFRNIVTYNRARYDRLDDADPSFTGVLAGTNTLDSEDSFFRDNLTQSFTEELRLHYESDRLRAHIGVYYSHIDNDDDSGSTGGIPVSAIESGIAANGLGPFSAILVPLYSQVRLGRDVDFNSVTTNYAGFGEISYDFTRFITGYAGLRYDNEKLDFSNNEVRTFEGLPDPATDCTFDPFLGPAVCAGFNTFILADAAAAGASPDVSAESEAWLPMVGTTLNWTEDLATSFTLKRGYRAGGAGVSLVSGTLFQFDPEFAWNYEFALRSQWFDRRLTFNTNVFYMDWTDQQVSAPGPSGPVDSIVINAGQSQSYGVEVETYAQPTDQLTLRGSVGYLETEFLDLTNGGVDLSGNEFPNAPNWTLAAAARYQFQGGIYVQADANYRSAGFTDPENRPRSFEEERTLINGRLGYKTENIDAYVYSTNIFDVDYIAHQSELVDTSKVGDGRFVGFRVKLTNE